MHRFRVRRILRSWAKMRVPRRRPEGELSKKELDLNFRRRRCVNSMRRINSTFK